MESARVLFFTNQIRKLSDQILHSSQCYSSYCVCILQRVLFCCVYCAQLNTCLTHENDWAVFEKNTIDFDVST